MNLKNMKECDKSKNTCKQQLPIVYMSFNNVGHIITSTITTLQHFATLYHTSPNYTSLQCCHNKHKNFPMVLHVMYLYFPDTRLT